ncbi:MAG TPA: hypothetical protein VIJ14_05870 [Rhabdochlamydiaceae bacterium]
MSTVVDVLKGAVDAAFRNELEKNRYYKSTKQKLEADAVYVGTVEKVAAAVGLASSALAVLGIGCCASGHEQAGAALICVDVPLAILAYGCYKASENLRTQVFEDPVKWMVLDPANKKVLVNVVELRKCLLNGTVFFEPFVGLYGRKFLSSVEREQ